MKMIPRRWLVLIALVAIAAWLFLSHPISEWRWVLFLLTMAVGAIGSAIFWFRVWVNSPPGNRY